VAIGGPRGAGRNAGCLLGPGPLPFESIPSFRAPTEEKKYKNQYYTLENRYIKTHTERENNRATARRVRDGHGGGAKGFPHRMAWPNPRGNLASSQ
jgi:hypothetical protein